MIYSRVKANEFVRGELRVFESAQVCCAGHDDETDARHRPYVRLYKSRGVDWVVASGDRSILSMCIKQHVHEHGQTRGVRERHMLIRDEAR